MFETGAPRKVFFPQKSGLNKPCLEQRAGVGGGEEVKTNLTMNDSKFIEK